MRLFYLITSIICITSIIHSEEIEDPAFVQTLKEEPTPSIEPPALIPPPHGYFKIGTSILYQGVGVGKRWRDFSTLRGNDWAFNVKTPLILGVYFPFTSLEYTRLFYNPYNADIYKYFGIGLEVGVFLDKNTRHYPIPNPKIMWGKEHLDGHFTQWSLNLLPTAVFASGVFTSLSHKHHHNCGIEQAIGIVALGTMFEFTYGF